MGKLIVLPYSFNDFDLRLFRGTRFRLDESTLCQFARAVLLSKCELTFIHVPLLVNTDALAMPHVFKPLPIILPLDGHFLPHAVPKSLEPGSVVDVHICGPVFF